MQIGHNRNCDGIHSNTIFQIMELVLCTLLGWAEKLI